MIFIKKKIIMPNFYKSPGVYTSEKDLTFRKRRLAVNSAIGGSAPVFKPSGVVPSPPTPIINWVLSCGYWNDAEIWDDSYNWQDNITCAPLYLWVLSCGDWVDTNNWVDSGTWEDSTVC
jgi:hypothetical protein